MKFAIQIVTVLLATAGFAQIEGGNLKSSMKEMASALKSISAQAADASKNSSSSDLAGKFVVAAQQARTFYPSSANDKTSQTKYTNMMDAAIANGQALQAAFASNDNTKAAAILSQLVQEKKDGHDQFRQ